MCFQVQLLGFVRQANANLIHFVTSQTQLTEDNDLEPVRLVRFYLAIAPFVGKQFA